LHKNFKLILTLLIGILTLPLLGSTALAETESYDLEDGGYEIDLESLHANEDEESGAAGFIGDKASLSIEDGNIELTVTIPHNDMAEITGLQVEGSDPTVEKGDEADYYTYQLDDLATYLSGQVQYEVPDVIEGDEPFRFHLKGLDKLPVKEDNDEPSEPEDEENNLENEDKKENKSNNSEEANESIKLDKGYYTINASYLRDDNDDSSAMGSYLDNAAFISVKDGKVNLTITVAEHQTVTKLQIEDKNAAEKKVDGDKRYETFVLDQLPSTLNAYVEYQAPFQGETFEGQADFRISFEDGSLKDAKASDKPGKEVSVEPDKDTEDKDKKKTGDEKPESKTNKANSNKQGKNKRGTIDKGDTEKDNLVPDKAYEINYVVKHETEDKVSTADSFFKKPAYLLYKNDEKYIQLTVTNSDMINSLSTANGDVIIVKENDDGSMIIQFKLDGDLSDGIDLNMFISVPDMPAMPGGYDEEHDARLFLDPNSKKEVDATEFVLVASDNGNGPTVKGENNGQKLGGGKKLNEGNNNEKPNENISKKFDEISSGITNTDDTPEKPEFGSNGDNGKGPNTENSGNAQNPQTGDTSGILLYTLLLIGSLIPLAVKLKRRFV